MTIPANFFGVSTLNYSLAFNPAFKAGTVRNWDASGDTALTRAGNGTNGLNQTQGNFNFGSAGATGYLTAWTANANALGQQLVFNLGGTPAWDGSYMVGMPSDAGWTAWCQAVFAQFKGMGVWYELWNEPNGTQFCNFTVAQMLHLATITRAQLLAIDPTAKLLTPACVDNSGAATSGVTWISNFLAQAGAAALFDGMAWHPYCAGGVTPTAEAIYAVTQAYQAIAAKYGYTLLVASELNWTNESGVSAAAADQPIIIAKTYLYHLYGGITSVIWYGADPSQGNILNAGTTTLNAAGLALQDLQSELVGATITGKSLAGSTYTLSYTRADGVLRQTTWNNTDTAPTMTTVAPTAPASITVTLPEPISLTATSITVSVQAGQLSIALNK